MSSAASLAGRTRWATTVSSTGGLPTIDNGVLGVTMMPLEAATLVGTLTPRGDMYKSRDWENSGPRLQCLGTSDLPSGVGARELADPADCAREMGDAAEFDGDACIIGARVSVEMLLIALSLECLMPCMSLSLESFKRMSGCAYIPQKKNNGNPWGTKLAAPPTILAAATWPVAAYSSQMVSEIVCQMYESFPYSSLITHSARCWRDRTRRDRL